MPGIDAAARDWTPEDIVMLDADDDNEEYDSSSDYNPSDDEEEIPHEQATRRQNHLHRTGGAITSPIILDSPEPQVEENDLQGSAMRPESINQDETHTINVATANALHQYDVREPWGAPVVVRARTVYPPSFPPKLRELIALIPVQDGPIGQNIRPVVVDVLRSSFTSNTLRAIATFLSMAPAYVLRDFATVIADIVNECFEAQPGSSITFAELEAHHGYDFWNRVVVWLRCMCVDQERYRISLPFGVQQFMHLFLEHAEFVSRPTMGQRIRIDITHCGERCTPVPRRTLDHVRAYITSLSQVFSADLDVDARCNICLQEYYPRSPPRSFLRRTISAISVLSGNTSQSRSSEPAVVNEQPVRLPCGHHIGRDCLALLLAPKPYADEEYSSCPLCRAKLDIVGVGVGH